MLKSLLCSFALVLTMSLTAQVHINEYSASNLNSFQDSYGKTEDWIELHNSGNFAVDLSGWHLSDKENKPKKWEIPAGTTIEPNGFLVFLCSGRDLIREGEYHTNFKLTQTRGSDIVLFSDPDGEIQEMFPLDMTLVEHSRCREVDGSNDWKVCTSPTFGTSNNGSDQVNAYTNTPSIDLEAGFYTGTQTVTLTNNEPNSTLRYTLDGTNPTPTSPEYLEPIIVSTTTVVKAQSFSNDALVLPGRMEFSTYFIDEEYSLAVFSVAADEVINLANGNGELIPIGSIEYFNLDREREATSFGSLNRHGQDSWVLDHRSLDWVSRDEMGYSKDVNAPLFSYSDRDEYQKFMFRNSGDDNYPAINDAAHEGSTHIRDEYVQTLAQEGEMKLDLRAVERVVLFLNGQYWGVYGMRERPVDHDYTGEYYDQGKYETQYITTWGDTEVQYGGRQALTEWENLRDFILENDMSDPDNYETAADSLNMTSLIDYMIVNLNVVASDWLNYNTGWWRGRNPEGDHKKWGYILWDLDATFDYYINYTNIPDISPEAEPCDLDDISEYMDEFFGEDGGGGGGPDPDTVPLDSATVAACPTFIAGGVPYPISDTIMRKVMAADGFCCSEGWDQTCQNIYNRFSPDNGPEPVIPLDSATVAACPTFIDGGVPYPISDTIMRMVMAADDFCCAQGWDQTCQGIYDNFRNGGGGGGDEGGNSGGDQIEGIPGNVGSHEKIFLKLIEENPVFRQLYYSRYADMANTVFSCDNMNATLDRMLAVIEPEMPRQIQRWGGTMSEWRSNVEELRGFINQRCENLQSSLLCYEDVSGPYQLTLLTQPDGIGEIDLNTLDIESFPWSGSYYGGMENLIKAKVFDEFEDDYAFSHWESRSGNVIFPDSLTRRASLTLESADTLVAVFASISSTSDFAMKYGIEIFPNPASTHLSINYTLRSSLVSGNSFETSQVQASLYNSIGERVAFYPNVGPATSVGEHQFTLAIDPARIPAGFYFLNLRIGSEQQSFKVNIAR